MVTPSDSDDLAKLDAVANLGQPAKSEHQVQAGPGPPSTGTGGGGLATTAEVEEHAAASPTTTLVKEEKGLATTAEEEAHNPAVEDHEDNNSRDGCVLQVGTDISFVSDVIGVMSAANLRSGRITCIQAEQQNPLHSIIFVDDGSRLNTRWHGERTVTLTSGESFPLRDFRFVVGGQRTPGPFSQALSKLHADVGPYFKGLLIDESPSATAVLGTNNLPNLPNLPNDQEHPRYELRGTTFQCIYLREGSAKPFHSSLADFGMLRLPQNGNQTIWFMRDGFKTDKHAVIGTGEDYDPIRCEDLNATGLLVETATTRWSVAEFIFRLQRALGDPSATANDRELGEMLVLEASEILDGPRFLQEISSQIDYPTRREFLKMLVQRELANAHDLRLTPADEHTCFSQLGLDSIRAVQLRYDLETSIGVSDVLPSVLDIPSLTFQGLIDHIGRGLGLAPAPAQALAPIRPIPPVSFLDELDSARQHEDSSDCGVCMLQHMFAVAFLPDLALPLVRSSFEGGEDYRKLILLALETENAKYLSPIYRMTEEDEKIDTSQNSKITAEDRASLMPGMFLNDQVVFWCSRIISDEVNRSGLAPILILDPLLSGNITSEYIKDVEASKQVKRDILAVSRVILPVNLKAHRHWYLLSYVTTNSSRHWGPICFRAYDSFPDATDQAVRAATAKNLGLFLRWIGIFNHTIQFNESQADEAASAPHTASQATASQAVPADHVTSAPHAAPDAQATASQAVPGIFWTPEYMSGYSVLTSRFGVELLADWPLAQLQNWDGLSQCQFLRSQAWLASEHATDIFMGAEVVIHVPVKNAIIHFRPNAQQFLFRIRSTVLTQHERTQLTHFSRALFALVRILRPVRGQTLSEQQQEIISQQDPDHDNVSVANFVLSRAGIGNWDLSHPTGVSVLDISALVNDLRFAGQPRRMPQVDADRMRDRVVTFLCYKPPPREMLFDQTLSSYLITLARSSTFGGHFEIEGLCAILDAPILVLEGSSGPACPLTIRSLHGRHRTGLTIILFLSNPGENYAHYSLCIPKNLAAYEAEHDAALRLVHAHPITIVIRLGRSLLELDVFGTQGDGACLFSCTSLTELARHKDHQAGGCDYPFFMTREVDGGSLLELSDKSGLPIEEAKRLWQTPQAKVFRELACTHSQRGAHMFAESAIISVLKRYYLRKALGVGLDQDHSVFLDPGAGTGALLVPQSQLAPNCVFIGFEMDLHLHRSFLEYHRFLQHDPTWRGSMATRRIEALTAGSLEGVTNVGMFDGFPSLQADHAHVELIERFIQTSSVVEFSSTKMSTLRAIRQYMSYSSIINARLLKEFVPVKCNWSMSAGVNSKTTMYVRKLAYRCERAALSENDVFPGKMSSKNLSLPQNSWFNSPRWVIHSSSPCPIKVSPTSAKWILNASNAKWLSATLTSGALALARRVGTVRLFPGRVISLACSSVCLLRGAKAMRALNPS